MSKWLITGGAGYIGAHVVREMLNNNFELVVLDDLSTGVRSNIPKNVVFLEGSVTDKDFLKNSTKDMNFSGVIHLAAKKSVEESVKNSEFYFEQNVGGMQNLLDFIQERKIRNFVFSSSAAVYGESSAKKIREDFPANPTSPYGETKLICEEMLKDLKSIFDFNYVSLRYFNVVGSAENNLGDRSSENLFPKVFNRITANKSAVIYGDDYDTSDGTCVRDYIDVRDLSTAHQMAARYLEENNQSMTLNVGTGIGSSVKTVIDSIRNLTKVSFEISYEARRAGDPAVLVADSELISKVLGWKFNYTLEDSIRSSWAAHVFLRQELYKP